MRIGLLHVDLPPVAVGGVAYQVDLLARQLVSRGHQTTVFTATPTAGRRSYAVEVLDRPACGPLSPFIGAGLAFRRAALSELDIVHAHGDAWALADLPVVRTFHGTALDEARSATSARRRVAQTAHFPLEVISLLRSTLSTAVSENTRRLLPGIDCVIPNAVDNRVFYPGSKRFERPTVLMVAGRLGGRKRGQMVLDAFNELRRRLPEAEMIAVTHDEVHQEGVRTLAALDPDELGELYRRSWVLCSASSYEAFGIPYVEALASGLPVVTTTNPGAEEILGRHGVGRIVEPRLLAEAMLAVLTDEGEARAQRERGLEASVVYGADAVVARYEQAYDEARSRHGSTSKHRFGSRSLRRTEKCA